MRMNNWMAWPICGVIALVSGGCNTAEEVAGEERAQQVEAIAEAKIQPKPKPVQVGEAHYREELKGIENQAAVSWLKEGEDNTITVGVVRAAWDNDKMPVVEACLRAQSSKGEPITAYIVDESLATETWKVGDDGLIESLKMPLSLKRTPTQ